MESEILRLAHITDTHFCKSYAGNSMEGMFAKGRSPEDKLRTLLRKTVSEKCDCLMISGDIVHEGVEEDYVRFREIVEEEIKDRMEVVYVCGNHDRKQAFKQGLKMSCQTDSVYYVKYVKGYRIVVLDSAIEGKENGSVSPEQESWLREVLKEDYGNGTLVTFHHPIAWDMPQLSMKISDEMKKIFAESDVIGIFCGHTHSNNVQNWQGIKQYTADAMAFGMDMSGENFRFVEKGGMNFYRIEGANVSVHVEALYNDVTVLAEIPMQKLLEMMQ